MERIVMTVPAISCSHCEQAITKALEPVQGVFGVKVDIPAHLVMVDFDGSKMSLDRLTAILAAEDYPVASVREGGN